MSWTAKAQVKQKPLVNKLLSHGRPGGGHVATAEAQVKQKRVVKEINFTQKTWRWSCRRQPRHKSNRNQT